MAHARRRLYKPERPAARKAGVFRSVIRNGLYEHAPLGCPDANPGEVSKAIFALARSSGVTVGQGSGYDALRDEYAVIGKSSQTGKAQDFTIAGEVVAELIRYARALNGGKMELGRLRETLN